MYESLISDEFGSVRYLYTEPVQRFAFRGSVNAPNLKSALPGTPQFSAKTFSS